MGRTQYRWIFENLKKNNNKKNKARNFKHGNQTNNVVLPRISVSHHRFLVFPVLPKVYMEKALLL